MLSTGYYLVEQDRNMHAFRGPNTRFVNHDYFRTHVFVSKHYVQANHSVCKGIVCLYVREHISINNDLCGVVQDRQGVRLCHVPPHVHEVRTTVQSPKLTNRDELTPRGDRSK